MSILKLLYNLQEINFDIPTAMYIRHSERPRILDLNDSNMLLNQRGKKAAYEFGKRLPRDCSYRLHQTYYDRTRKTAEEIVRGVKGSGGKVVMAGTLDLKTILDPERYNHYCRKDFLEGDPPESAIDYFYKWTSNRYPPNEIISSFEFAKKERKSFYTILN